MTLLDWLLPKREQAVRQAMTEHAAANERLRKALDAGELMTVGQQLDDIRDALSERRKTNGKH